MLSEKKANNYFDGLEISTTHKILYSIIMLAYFFEQMDNWNFGFVAPALIKSWGLTMADIGKIQLWYFVGMTAGGLCGGVLSDFFGRRKVFLGSVLIFSLASVANGFAQDLTTFIVTRSLTGFGVFCLMVCSQAYIAEVSPAESRGKWQSLIAAVGFCAAPFVGLACRMIIPMSPEAWRYIFWFGGLGLIAFVAGLYYIKESPRWLVAHNRADEAEKVVEQISGVKVCLNDAVEASKKSGLKESALTTLVGMFSGNYIKRTLIIAALYIITTPAGFTITTWTPTLLAQKGFSVEESLTISTVLMIGVPVGCFLASLISDMGGRKLPLVGTAAATAVCAVVFSMSSGFVFTTAAGFATIMFNMAFGFITFAYIAESYPTRMRNTAVGTHLAAGRFATSFFQPVVPMIFAGTGFFGTLGISGFIGVYGVIAFLIFLPLPIVLIWGMRTGGKSLEEIS